MVAPQYYLYDDTAFRAMFPAFADSSTFSSALLQVYWNQGCAIIENNGYGYVSNRGGPLAMNLITAHLAALSVLIANGENPGVATGAGIDKINLTLMPPPLKTQFSYWLGTTPYGQQLMANLQAAGAGGGYVPGGMGRMGFRA